MTNSRINIIPASKYFEPITEKTTGMFFGQTPFDENFIEVKLLNKSHKIWYTQYGNPKGQPILVLHGGPGSGSNISDVQFFNPKIYRIILFDQRCCGRSSVTPLENINDENYDNNTQNIICDIEQLRSFLNIDSWFVFGSSWGSTLGLLYSQKFSHSVKKLLLCSTFLARKQDVDYIWNEMGRFFPQQYEVLLGKIPKENFHKQSVMEHYFKGLTSQDSNVQTDFAYAFMNYDFQGSFLTPRPNEIESRLENIEHIMNVAKIFTYFCINNFFIKENEILININKIKNIPIAIIHGRYDLLCPLSISYDLYKECKHAQLYIVEDGSHTRNQISMAKAICEVVAKFF